MRCWRCPADPVGAVFRNSGQRLAYIREKAKEFDAIEAQAASMHADEKLGYQNSVECNGAGGTWTTDRQETFGGHCN